MFTLQFVETVSKMNRVEYYSYNDTLYVGIPIVPTYIFYLYVYEEHIHMIIQC